VRDCRLNEYLFHQLDAPAPTQGMQAWLMNAQI